MSKKGKISWQATRQFWSLNAKATFILSAEGTVVVEWSGDDFNGWERVRDWISSSTDSLARERRESMKLSEGSDPASMWTSPVHSIEEVT